MELTEFIKAKIPKANPKRNYYTIPMKNVLDFAYLSTKEGISIFANKFFKLKKINFLLKYLREK